MNKFPKLWIPDPRYWILDSTTVDAGFQKGCLIPVCSQMLNIAFRFLGMTSLGGFYCIIGRSKYMETSLLFYGDGDYYAKNDEEEGLNSSK